MNNKYLLNKIYMLGIPLGIDIMNDSLLSMRCTYDQTYSHLGQSSTEPATCWNLD